MKTCHFRTILIFPLPMTPDAYGHVESDAEKLAHITGKIERAKRELEQMIDLNPQVILLVDRHCRILRANKKALEYLGKQKFSEILHRHMHDLFQCPALADPEAFLRDCRGYQTTDAEVTMPSGARRTLRFSVVGSGHSQNMFVIMITDVDEEKKVAARVEKEHKKEAVKALAGALMHSINQPLTVIIMRSQMLKIALDENRTDPIEVRRSLQDIMRLALGIADTLQNVERSRDFVTESYTEGVDILDLGKSGATAKENQISCSILLDDLLRALEERTPGAVTHARLTGELAGILAQLMRLDWRVTEIIRQAAIVHDIGKIAVPDAILVKPQMLDTREDATMQKHVEFGYHILRSLIFFEEEAQAVKTHHERFDGKGYPEGITGEKIPMSARIIAVADAFEVMRSGRPYKAAMNLDETMAELRRAAGTQFDPRVVELAEKHVTELDAVITGGK